MSIKDIVKRIVRGGGTDSDRIGSEPGMGAEIIRVYQTRVKSSWKIAFKSALIIGLFAHLYKFTNTLPNHDSLVNFYNDQNILGSGRWFLSIACGVSSYYDLPWTIGVMSLVLIAITSVVITDLFRIENPVLICIVSGILTTFPSITETFFFEFTADGYMLAMLLASLAVHLSQMRKTYSTAKIITSGIFICLSCGIYQAYVSFAMVLALCYLMYQLLTDSSMTPKSTYRWIVMQLLLYLLSLAAYYVIWKICMAVQHVAPNNYQGIASVGALTISTILNGAIATLKTLFFFFLQWNLFEHGFTTYNLLNAIFLMLFITLFLCAAFKSRIITTHWKPVLLVLALLLCIPSICIWHFTSTEVVYRPMMLMSISVLYIFAALLCDKYVSGIRADIVCILLLTITANFAIMANISYFKMERCYENSYSEGIQMVSEINTIEEKYEKVAVLGNRIFEVQTDAFVTSSAGIASQNSFYSNYEGISILADRIESTLLYDHVHTVMFLQNVLHCKINAASSAEINELSKLQVTAEMPCWPQDGSICVVDEYLIIKLTD